MAFLSKPTRRVTSCGRRRTRAAARSIGVPSLTETSEYGVWIHMRSRCSNPNATSFKHYGGRGIAVCERWRDSFLNFYRDMGPRPSPKHTVDRIDNDGNYEPGNCRWATWTEQARNRRSCSPLVTVGKEAHTVAEWAGISGRSVTAIKSRLRLYRNPEEAIFGP